MPKNDKIEPPKGNIEHKGQLLAKGALGGVPFVGGLAGETLDLIWKTGYEKRLHEWRVSVSESLSRKLDVDELPKLIDNVEFKSLFAESTTVVLKNHQEEKLNAIKNLLTNSTVSPIEYDFKKLFINFIDQFTSFHLRTIGHIHENLHSNHHSFLTLNDHMKQILEDVFHGDEELRGQIFEELIVVKGLVTKKKGPIFNYNSTSYYALTSLGEKFIGLINEEDSA